MIHTVTFRASYEWGTGKAQTETRPTREQAETLAAQLRAHGWTDVSVTS